MLGHHILLHELDLSFIVFYPWFLLLYVSKYVVTNFSRVRIKLVIDLGLLYNCFHSPFHIKAKNSI